MSVCLLSFATCLNYCLRLVEWVFIIGFGFRVGLGKPKERGHEVAVAAVLYGGDEVMLLECLHGEALGVSFDAGFVVAFVTALYAVNPVC